MQNTLRKIALWLLSLTWAHQHLHAWRNEIGDCKVSPDGSHIEKLKEITGFSTPFEYAIAFNKGYTRGNYDGYSQAFNDSLTDAQHMSYETWEKQLPAALHDALVDRETALRLEDWGNE